MKFKNVLKLLLLSFIGTQSSNVIAYKSFDSSKVVLAVNAGGTSHTDSSHIIYDRDQEIKGFPSHSGNLVDEILGAAKEDLTLFLTDRAGSEGFDYQIPVPSDGRFVLVLKFVETSINETRKRLFDVTLNGLEVLSSVDVFAKVGFATVYQAVIPFVVSDTRTTLELPEHEDISGIDDAFITLEFKPRPGFDRPKVNAFYVYKGKASDIPTVFIHKDPKTKPIKSKVVYAVNAGGQAYTDTTGIHYYADSLKVGTASSHGMTLIRIRGVHPEDEVLYRTERYHTHSFSYSLPVSSDGSYTLVLKFSEVWFKAAGEKVFDVILNGKHKIVNNLDIFRHVGFGVALDKVVPLKITNGGKILKWNEETSSIRGGQVNLEFRKGSHDNPKINAFYLIKGSPEDLPNPPPFEQDVVEEQMSDKIDSIEDSWNTPEEGVFPELRQEAQYRQNDPWENESLLNVVLPLVIALLVGGGLLGVMCVWIKSPLQSF